MIKINSTTAKKLNIRPYYFVDELGKIYSNCYGDLRELKQRVNRNGYKQIGLASCDNCQYTIESHRLIYIAFNGLIKDKLVVDHINDIKTDNRIENLRLVTNAENIRKGWANGRAISDKHRESCRKIGRLYGAKNLDNYKKSRLTQC